MSTSSPSSAAAEETDQPGPELLAHAAVDDEVDRRVDGEQQVVEVEHDVEGHRNVIPALQLAVLVVLLGVAARVGELVERQRQAVAVAQDEEHHDEHEHNRRLIPAAAEDARVIAALEAAHVRGRRHHHVSDGDGVGATAASDISVVVASAAAVAAVATVAAVAAVAAAGLGAAHGPHGQRGGLVAAEGRGQTRRNPQ